MPKYVAFLRAINVGGHVVKMDRLRDLFLKMGLTNVETFIASGNVIFEANVRNAQTLERKIEKQLEAELGYPVTTFIRSVTELKDVAALEPFAHTPSNGEPGTLFIGFLGADPDGPAKKKLLACSSDVDLFQLHGRELYWLCRIKSNESKFSGTLLERTLGMRTTIRNSNTIRRIVAKYS
jgi:uncharacterized protein (DUF1697 family)